MKIILLHPAIRKYREPLYRMLGEYGVHFLFTSLNDPASHSGKETSEILSRFPYCWTQGRQIKRIPIKNLTPDLWRAFLYDTVIFTRLTSPPFLLLAPFLRLLGKRVLLFEETWRYPHGVRRYRLMYPYVRFLVRRCTGAIITAGTAAKKMLMNEFGVCEKRLFIAYNTTKDCQLSPNSEVRAARIEEDARSFASGRTILLFLARIVQIKALDVLLHAMTSLPENVCLLVVGTGPEEQQCMQLTHELGLAEQVKFMGDCVSDDAVHFYRLADIFVFPSRFIPNQSVNSESWGFTLNEAMSMEIPVVATTAVGAAHDLIIDTVTGMLAEQDDPRDLATKIGYLLEDAERRQEIGRQGRKRLLERCRYEQNFEAWKAAIELATGANRKLND